MCLLVFLFTYVVVSKLLYLRHLIQNVAQNVKKILQKMCRRCHKVIKSQDVHELFCPKHLLIFVLIEPFFDKYLVVCILYNSTYYLDCQKRHFNLYLIEPVCCKKQQKKVPDQLLVCGIGDL